MEVFWFGLAGILFLFLPLIAVVMLIGIRRAVNGLRREQEATRAMLRALRDKLIPPEPAPESEPASVKAVTAPAPEPPPAPPEPEPAIPAVPPPAPVTPPVPPSPPAPEPDRPRSRAVSTVSDILARIWSWILVGEEHRPEGVTAEYAIASTWLLRMGIVALVACAVFFLRWSVDRQLIGPAGRVAMGILAGMGMLLGGLRLVGRKYHLIGQGLLGGGLLVCYASIYTASPMMFDLTPLTVAFLLMLLVTAAAGVLSLRTNSLLVAVIGLAGAYVTPVLLRTETPDLAGLYGYMLLISLGILAIAYAREWRILNWLAFAATYSLFFVTLETAYETELHFPLAITFLTLLFVTHSLIVFIHGVVRGKTSSTLDILHMVINAAVYSGTGYFLIRDAHGGMFPALLTLGLAAFFIAHAAVFLKRGPRDRKLLLAWVALAGAFAAWTLPIVFEKETLTISLALLAFTFFWLGGRLGSGFIRSLGQLLYAIVFFRMLALDLPRNFPARTAADLTFGAYCRALADRLWTFGVSIGSIAAAFFLQRRAEPARQDATPKLSAPVWSGALYWFGILFVFLFLHLELNVMFSFFNALRLPVLTALWCAMAFYFLWAFLDSGRGRHTLFVAMWVFLAGAVVKLFAVDALAWELSDNLVYQADYAVLDSAMRLLDFGVVVALLAAVWIWPRRQGAPPAPVFGYGALALFFIYMTLETKTLLHWKLAAFEAGGVSVLWSLFAIAFLATGVLRNLRALRYAGLALFAVVLVKVFFHDLADMDVIYRVIAFMIVGMALVGGSFVYLFASRQFERPAGRQARISKQEDRS